MTALEKTKERFQKDERLREWLPVLNEYRFSDAVLLQLVEKGVDAVVRFCAAVDE